jgi:hypothetical protein
MGYTTEFEGSFEIKPALTKKQEKYINAFSDTRRMKRDVDILNKHFSVEKHSAPGKDDFGKDGEYFVYDDGNFGQKDFMLSSKNKFGNQEEMKFLKPSIVDYNTPPLDQPGLWCQWIVNDGELEWDGNEKFYNYIEWLGYLIDHFFEPWGCKLNGDVEWQGEDSQDIGIIRITDNIISAQLGRKVFD